jgi:hypothetical protein
MPPQIGDFISETMYDGQLKSNSLHPITTSDIACHFINVSQGQEQRYNSQDQSWCVSNRYTVLPCCQTQRVTCPLECCGARSDLADSHTVPSREPELPYHYSL